MSHQRTFCVEWLILRSAVTKDLLRSFLALLVRMRGRMLGKDHAPSNKIRDFQNHHV